MSGNDDGGDEWPPRHTATGIPDRASRLSARHTNGQQCQAHSESHFASPSQVSVGVLIPLLSLQYPGPLAYRARAATWERCAAHSNETAIGSWYVRCRLPWPIHSGIAGLG